MNTLSRSGSNKAKATKRSYESSPRIDKPFMAAMAMLTRGWAHLESENQEAKPGNSLGCLITKRIILKLAKVITNSSRISQLVMQCHGRLQVYAEHVSVAILVAYLLEVVELYYEFGYPSSMMYSEFMLLIEELKRVVPGFPRALPREYRTFKELFSNLKRELLSNGQYERAQPDDNIYFCIRFARGESAQTDLENSMSVLHNLSDCSIVERHFPFQFGVVSNEPQDPIGFAKRPLKIVMQGRIYSILNKYSSVLLMNRSEMSDAFRGDFYPWPSLQISLAVTADQWRKGAACMKLAEAIDELRKNEEAEVEEEDEAEEWHRMYKRCQTPPLEEGECPTYETGGQEAAGGQEGAVDEAGPSTPIDESILDDEVVDVVMKAVCAANLPGLTIEPGQ